jgi:diguanylate cyclase (GGDEF)-like protein/PAS domain S-box-containing protein
VTSDSADDPETAGPTLVRGAAALAPAPVAPRWAVRAALALTAAMVLVVVADPSTNGWLLVASGFAGGVVAVVFGRRAGGSERAAWVLLGAGQLLNGFGNIAIAVDATAWFAHGDNVTAVVFTLATATTGIGFAALLLPSRADRLSAAADGGLVVGSVFVVAWAYGAAGIFEPDGTTLPRLTGLLGVELDLLILLLGAVLLWWSRPHGHRWPVRVAVLAQLSATLADTGLLSGPLPQRLLGEGWLISSCLFGVGALLLSREEVTPTRQLDRDRSLTAVTAIVALCLVAVLGGARGGLDGVSLTGWAVVVLLLLVRQAHAVRRARSLALELTLRERRLRLIVSEMRDAILQLDLAGRVTFVSPALRHAIGRDGPSALGRPIYDLIHPQDVPLVRAAVESIGRHVKDEQRLQIRALTSTGEVVHIEALMTSVGSGLLVTVRDVSERVRLEAQLHAAAYHDQLTGLPNRAQFDHELAARFVGVPASPVGMVFLDLDGFKRINDTSGHPAGDAVLVESSRRIEGALRPGDGVFRFGGDEFTVLLRPGSTIADGAEVAGAVIGALGQPLFVDGNLVDLSATAGVAVGDAGGPAELVRNADLAMYSIKGVRRGAVGVFEPRMYDEFARRVELERRFARAHDAGELSLAYQPIVDLRTGRVVSAEALLRWRDQDGVVVGAEEFVPLAEGFGSIVTIGAWALREATRQAARWGRAGSPIDVSVNVSARQLLDTGLLPVVDRALRESGLEPHRLCLEITESVLLADDEVAPQVLSHLRALGVRLAIDDFGTGYSGLSYLRRLPVDQIKIDQSFLRASHAEEPARLAPPGEPDPLADGRDGREDGLALLAGVVLLGRDLGLTVTVEGVETEEQVATLRALKADRGQGYLFARPQTEDAMLAWARARFTGRDSSPHAEMGS